MSSISPWIGREQEFEALGQAWRFGRWERRVWWELLQWARPQVPNPLDLVKDVLPLLPPATAAAVAKEAIAASRTFLSVLSPEVKALIGSLEGSTQIVYLLLKDHHPKVSEDDAFRIVLSLGDRLEGMLAIARGESYQEKNDEAPGPNA